MCVIRIAVVVSHVRVSQLQSITSTRTVKAAWLLSSVIVQPTVWWSSLPFIPTANGSFLSLQLAYSFRIFTNGSLFTPTVSQCTIAYSKRSFRLKRQYFTVQLHTHEWPFENDNSGWTTFIISPEAFTSYFVPDETLPVKYSQLFALGDASDTLKDGNSSNYLGKHIRPIRSFFILKPGGAVYT